MRSDWIELGPIRWREMESRLGEMRSDQLCYALRKFRERERKAKAPVMELMVVVCFFFFFFLLSVSKL